MHHGSGRHGRDRGGRLPRRTARRRRRPRRQRRRGVPARHHHRPAHPARGRCRLRHRDGGQRHLPGRAGTRAARATSPSAPTGPDSTSPRRPPTPSPRSPPTPPSASRASPQAGRAASARPGTSGLCGDGWSLFAPGRVAALPAGGVLVATSTSGSLVRLSLDTAGALSQPSGAAGCIRDTGTGSCPDGRALAGASDVTITPDGTAALVTAGTSDAIARIGLGATLSAGRRRRGVRERDRALGTVPRRARARRGRRRGGHSRRPHRLRRRATSNDTVAVLDLSASGFAQGADTTGCVSDRGGSGCATRGGLDGARGVAVDSAGRPVTAAETSDVVLAHRLNRAPSCTAAGARRPGTGPSRSHLSAPIPTATR